MRNKVPAALKMIDIEALLRSRGLYQQQETAITLKAAALPLARQLIEARKAPVDPPRHSQYSNEQLLAYWERQIHIIDVIEDKFERKLTQFITRVIEGFASNLEQEASSHNKGHFDDVEADLLVQAQFDLAPLLQAVAVQAGQVALDLINSKDVYTPIDLRNKIAANVAKFTQSMLDTDKESLTKVLHDGIKEGLSIAQIRANIQANLESMSKIQAQRIARTEVLRVSSQAAIDAWEQSGVVEGKQWLTAGAIDECADYEGQIVKLHGNFYDDITEFKDGDPPLHPNCRCVVIPVVTDTLD